MKTFISFGIGALFGAGVTAFIAKKHFEKKSNEMYEDVKNVLRRKDEELKSQIEELHAVKQDEMFTDVEKKLASNSNIEKDKNPTSNIKPDTSATSAEDRPTIHKTDYAAISSGKKTIEEDLEFIENTIEDEKSIREKEVKIISEEEWIDNFDDLPQVTLYITTNATVVNANTEKRINPDGIIGEDVVMNFLESGDSVWYVHNSRLNILYELNLDEYDEYIDYEY